MPVMRVSRSGMANHSAAGECRVLGCCCNVLAPQQRDPDHSERTRRHPSTWLRRRGGPTTSNRIALCLQRCEQCHAMRIMRRGPHPRLYTLSGHRHSLGTVCGRARWTTLMAVQRLPSPQRRLRRGRSRCLRPSRRSGRTRPSSRRCSRSRQARTAAVHSAGWAHPVARWVCANRRRRRSARLSTRRSRTSCGCSRTAVAVSTLIDSPSHATTRRRTCGRLHAMRLTL